MDSTFGWQTQCLVGVVDRQLRSENTGPVGEIHAWATQHYFANILIGWRLGCLGGNLNVSVVVRFTSFRYGEKESTVVDGRWSDVVDGRWSDVVDGRWSDVCVVGGCLRNAWITSLDLSSVMVMGGSDMGGVLAPILRDKVSDIRNEWYFDRPRYWLCVSV